MTKIALYNMSGEQAGEIDLNDDVFNIEVNEHVMYEAVKTYMANQRQGNQSTKTRSEVRGGGRKPWRQKGTGRARAGTIRSPLWKGGGVVFAPKQRDYSKKLPKKIKRLAMKSAFSSKVINNEMVVLDELKLDEIKTKRITEVLSNLKVDKKALIVTDDKNVYFSARNIKGVKTASVNKFIITKDALKKVEEVYS
jgi:large subunit ribosomal protein L4